MARPHPSAAPSEISPTSSAPSGQWILLGVVLAVVTAGSLLQLGGAPLFVAGIVEVIALAGALVWRERTSAGDRLLVTKKAQALDDIAAKLGAKDAEQTVVDLLAGLGNPKKPVQAVKKLSAQRAELTTFLDATKLDADLVKAAEDLDAERAELTTFLDATRLDADLVKAAESLAAERAALSTFLTTATLDTDLVKATESLAAERTALGTFLTTTKLDADLVKAAESLAAERAELTSFLTATKLDADLVKAAETLAAERAALTGFLTATKLDTDLLKAAESLAAERARHAEADQKVAGFVSTAADLMKAASEREAERARQAEKDRKLETFLTTTGLDADLVTAAEGLAVERAKHADAGRKLKTFLTTTSLGANLGEATAGLLAERAQRADAHQKLTTFLAATHLDANLVEAANDLAVERAQCSAAETKAATDLASLRQALKETIDKADQDRTTLDSRLDLANSKIETLEAAGRLVALDKEVASDGAKKFWTGDQSVRVFMSQIVEGAGNHSYIMPKKDGTARMRLRFFVVNVSPYDVKVTNIKFAYSATMGAFQVSGEYDGPPGEQPDAVVKLAPWRQQHFFLRVKGTLANVARIQKDSTRIACLFLHGNCFVTLKGQWSGSERAPVTGNTDYMLVSWEEYR